MQEIIDLIEYETRSTSQPEIQRSMSSISSSVNNYQPDICKPQYVKIEQSSPMSSYLNSSSSTTMSSSTHLNEQIQQYQLQQKQQQLQQQQNQFYQIQQQQQQQQQQQAQDNYASLFQQFQWEIENQDNSIVYQPNQEQFNLNNNNNNNAPTDLQFNVQQQQIFVPFKLEEDEQEEESLQYYQKQQQQHQQQQNFLFQQQQQQQQQQNVKKPRKQNTKINNNKNIDNEQMKQELQEKKVRKNFVKNMCNAFLTYLKDCKQQQNVVQLLKKNGINSEKFYAQYNSKSLKIHNQTQFHNLFNVQSAQSAQVIKYRKKNVQKNTLQYQQQQQNQSVKQEECLSQQQIQQQAIEKKVLRCLLNKFLNENMMQYCVHKSKIQNIDIFLKLKREFILLLQCIDEKIAVKE